MYTLCNYLCNLYYTVLNNVNSRYWRSISYLHNATSSLHSPLSTLHSPFNISESERRIIGGEYVISIERFPFMALSHRRIPVYGTKKTKTSTCGATILSPKYLLTAAHCVCQYITISSCKSYDTMSFEILVGSVDPRVDKAEVKVKALHVHPRYQSYDVINKCYSNFDIAVVELTKPLKFSKKIFSVRLPQPVSLDATNSLTSILMKQSQECVVLGWGKTFPTEPLREKQLKLATVELIDNQECIDYLKISMANYSMFQNNMFCSNTQVCTKHPYNNNNPCFGDSGGPLICDGVQIGIVSWAPSEVCMSSNFTETYTRVDINVKWINDIISKS